MSLFDEKNLTKWVVILPIVSVIVTAVVFVSTGIKNRTNNLEKETKQKQIKLLKEHKQDAMKKVNNMVSFLKNSKELQKEQAREDVKHMVNLALTVIKNIYDNNRQLTNKEIIEKVKTSLRNIRFWDGTGYFFMHSLEGVCLLLPPLPELEGKKSIDWKDAKDDFIIQKAIKISKEKGEDFIDWYWYKPDEEVMKKR